MKDNFVAIMAGTAIWLTVLTMVAWAPTTPRLPKIPAVFDEQVLLRHTKAAMAKYRGSIIDDMEMRAMK